MGRVAPVYASTGVYAVRSITIDKSLYQYSHTCYSCSIRVHGSCCTDSWEILQRVVHFHVPYPSSVILFFLSISLSGQRPACAVFQVQRKQLVNYQSHARTINAVILSRPALSSSVKPPTAKQSRSKTPRVTSLPSNFNTRGHTTSLFVSPSQAICPGYAVTS